MNSLFDFAFSEQGHNHIKADKVCQDSSGHYADESMAIIAVADGHGSDNYPRTDRGSSFAVDATIASIKEFVQTVNAGSIDISEDSESYLEQLAKSILVNWYAAVDSDLEKYPFSEEELAKVSEKYKKRYLSGERCEKAYGTTLIAACQTQDYWFGLQIGDGKCICVSSDGTMYEPIPWDDDCQANITTSICDSEAIDEFRFSFMTNGPVATFMGTDGIDDSYANLEEVNVLYRSILAIFAEHGHKVGEEEVQTFLPGLSRKGSGDDVSIAGMVSSSLPKVFVDVLKAQSEYSNAKSFKEKANHDVILASEKQEYILASAEKAKLNYELCMQKASEAQVAVEVALSNQASAITRFENAESALVNAIQTYKASLKDASTNETIVNAPPTAEVVGNSTEIPEVVLEQLPVEETISGTPTNCDPSNIPSAIAGGSLANNPLLAVAPEAEGETL